MVGCFVYEGFTVALCYLFLEDMRTDMDKGECALTTEKTDFFLSLGLGTETIKK